MRPLPALALSVCLASPALADGPDRASVLLGSRHVEPALDFDEVNPGLFLTWERDLDWTVGAFHNSYGRTSVAAMVGRSWEISEDVGIGVFGGAAHYPGDGRTFSVSAGDVVPLGGLQLRLGNAFVQVIPSDGEWADAIVTGGLTWRLP
ncbi:hypothetical protein [Histidinibacterium aquaticum]|uniref:Uncharacterized protein n=1 Tax=Histidinibacterium aquaticum TaxID=2613962 RepID=A0A5J5GAD2_9RHOB|nr:hypothetical protein [Histidinibacterium aquaticum]KAA9005086.1 hypothetical protein F3S47_18835 [Histidinibacterium aquaticum]